MFSLQGCFMLPECDELNPTNLRFYSQSNEDKAIFETFFINKDGPTLCYGTFVEIGALDGRLFSNTLFFEKYLNWSGVLIEGNPERTSALNRNRPNTKNFGGLCACPEGQKEVKFVMDKNSNKGQAVGGVFDSMSADHFQKFFKLKESKFVKVPCKPMGPILKDAAVQTIDVFFIDVEGGEAVVLESMDWTIPVRIIVIEVGQSQANDLFIRKYLTQHGFINTLPEWNIRSFCVSGGTCTKNEVFINPDYPALPQRKEQGAHGQESQ